MRETNNSVRWEISPYQNENGLWIPRVTIIIEQDEVSQTIPLEASEFEYEEEEEARKHAMYMVKEYIANNL